MNRDDIRLALLQQVPWLVVCTLVMDGGGVAGTCLKALIVFWVFVGLSVVVLREKNKLWLRRFVRWGFFPMFAVAWCVFPPEPLRVPAPHRGRAEVRLFRKPDFSPGRIVRKEVRLTKLRSLVKIT